MGIFCCPPFYFRYEKNLKLLRLIKAMDVDLDDDKLKASRSSLIIHGIADVKLFIRHLQTVVYGQFCPLN